MLHLDNDTIFTDFSSTSTVIWSTLTVNLVHLTLVQTYSICLAHKLSLSPSQCYRFGSQFSLGRPSHNHRLHRLSVNKRILCYCHRVNKPIPFAQTKSPRSIFAPDTPPQPLQTTIPSIPLTPLPSPRSHKLQPWPPLPPSSTQFHDDLLIVLDESLNSHLIGHDSDLPYALPHWFNLQTSTSACLSLIPVPSLSTRS
jgi:hypothetical protein